MSKFRWYSGSPASSAIRHIKLIGGDKVIAWRSTTLRKDHACANCARRIRRGERAFKRTSWGRPEQRLCAECVDRIERNHLTT